MLSKRWMSDTCEILLEDWEACVAQKEEGRRRAERMERYKAWCREDYMWWVSTRVGKRTVAASTIGRNRTESWLH